ncbi:MAG: alanine--tRNA ligase [Fimbriimonadaceae bacterium]|nr:alanine--tRNA ligase [Fimbriimonadaceae bacterium]
MNVSELRAKYLAFFESKGHQRFPASSLVPYDVTGRLDESLLFNGSGMNQFKPFFRGVAQPPHPRLMTCQKCLRTGDIEEVGDDSHLTLFEMLGNFSFGDYFKKEAVAFSWEFLTSPLWLARDTTRLSFTVFEEDDEAYGYWSEHLGAAGVAPESRVFRLDEDTNYWPAGSFTKGPPGPCGPNSEMFYWVPDDVPPPSVEPGEYTREDWLRDEAAGRWLEVWNDVFISSDWQGKLRDPARPEKGYEKTGMPDLPFQSIDTGMGLERTACVLGGFRSVYDTDAFQPVFRAMEALPFAGALAYGKDSSVDHAMRVIADHLRAACFCVGDGILPSNNGRGYVLRRLLRRAVLQGARRIGFGETFLYRLVGSVTETMGAYYPELVEKRPVIEETLKNEEALFRRTLAQGTTILSDKLRAWRDGTRAPSTPLDGPTAFMLYDTYGFPLEVTQELCAEIGVAVDVEGYRDAMAEAQERSRGASAMENPYDNVQVATIEHGGGRVATTMFLGYASTEAEGQIIGVRPVLDENGHARPAFVLALDQTVFYAESGGQVADTGVIVGPAVSLRVLDVTKQDGIYVHLVEAEGAPWEGLADDEALALLEQMYVGERVTGRVDPTRAETVRHHTATHLVHAALREVLGPHVTQAGSLVSPESLRFDFTHGKAMTDDELLRVEGIVNEVVWQAAPVRVYSDVPIDEARAMGAMALFGEKYGDRVRVVQVGDMAPDEPSFSRELCGGVHVRNTGQIGVVKILHESSVASGVRRITAVAGARALAWAREQESAVVTAADLLKANPKDLTSAVERALADLKEEKKKRGRMVVQSGGQNATHTDVAGIDLVTEHLAEVEAQDAKLVVDKLAAAGRVVVVFNTADGKVGITASVGAVALAQGAHAGNLLREVAKVVGGGGGGKPEFATAGGKDPAKVADAMAGVAGVLAGMLK